MADLVAVSSGHLQSSLLRPGVRSLSPSLQRLHSPRSVGGLTARSGFSSLSHAIRAESQRSRLFFARVSSGSGAPTSGIDSVGEEEAPPVQPDTTGGDGNSGGRGDKNSGGDSGGGGGGGSEEGGGEGKEEKKAGMSMSQKLTLGYAMLVGIGGVMGYVKGGSKMSLAVGGLTAALLFFAYTLLPSNPTYASSVGLGVSVALLGVMGPRFKRSGKVFPAGVLSAVSLVMTGGYLHGILRGMH